MGYSFSFILTLKALHALAKAMQASSSNSTLDQKNALKNNLKNENVVLETWIESFEMWKAKQNATFSVLVIF